MEIKNKLKPKSMRSEPHEDRLKPLPILIASNLGGVNILQKPRLIVTEINTHTWPRSQPLKNPGEDGAVAALHPAAASHQ